MAPQFTLLCIFAVFAGATTTGLSQSDAAQEILNIVNNPQRYSKEIRPYPSAEEPLNVESSMYIRHVSVDDINMMIKVDMMLRMYWQDPRLTFSTEGVETVRFTDVSKFWVPDVFFRDSMNTDESKTIGPESLIKISQEGDVLYSKRMIVNLKCDMDITMFPHDSQICPISFESYGYSVDDVVFAMKEGTPLDFNNEMEIVKKFSLVDVNADVYISSTTTGEYSGIEVDLIMQREFYAYFLEWYMPCILYAIMSFFSLFVTDIFPQIFLSVIPLSSILVSILYYSQNLPTVPYVTGIDVFTVLTVLAIGLTLLYSVVSHFYQTNNLPEGKLELESNERWRRIYGTLRRRSDFFAKLLIIGFYFSSLFVYFLSYAA